MTLTIPSSNRRRNLSVGASILLHALLIFGPLLLGLIHSMLPPVLTTIATGSDVHWV